MLLLWEVAIKVEFELILLGRWLQDKWSLRRRRIIKVEFYGLLLRRLLLNCLRSYQRVRVQRKLYRHRWLKNRFNYIKLLSNLGRRGIILDVWILVFIIKCCNFIIFKAFRLI